MATGVKSGVNDIFENIQRLYIQRLQQLARDLREWANKKGYGDQIIGEMKLTDEDLKEINQIAESSGVPEELWKIFFCIASEVRIPEEYKDKTFKQIQQIEARKKQNQAKTSKLDKTK